MNNEYASRKFCLHLKIAIRSLARIQVAMRATRSKEYNNSCGRDMMQRWSSLFVWHDSTSFHGYVRDVDAAMDIVEKYAYEMHT